MRPPALTLLVAALAACGSSTISPRDGGVTPLADAPPAGADVPATSRDAAAGSDATAVRPDATAAGDATTPGAQDTALAYCRASCAAVVRCDPSRVAASCELSCARERGDLRLRAGVWQRGVTCAAGLTCAAVGDGDDDRLFERCVLPAAMSVPPSEAAARLCAATEALAARLGRCRDVPTGAECSLIMPLFSDAALDAARAGCFGPSATCDSARACMFNALGVRGG